MKHFSLRYSLLTFRLDQLWLPAALWALCAIVTFFRGTTVGAFDIARGYLGGIVPLVGGIMAAYALVDDPILEVRFATPVKAAWYLIERLGMIFVVQMICALTYQWLAQAMGADLLRLNGWAGVQLGWLIPTITLMALGCAGSLLFANTTAGAALVGVTWLLEVVLRDWMMQNGSQYVLFLMGVLYPAAPALKISQAVLTGLSLGLLILSWRLLYRQERYI